MGTYLVTGAAGFIAARTIHFLLDAGHEVVGADNLNDAYDVRLKLKRLDGLKDRPGFTFHRLDIGDRDRLRTIFADRRFDGVVNLAARAGVRQSVDDPWVYYETNVVGTLNLLDTCRSFGVPKFVLASTSSLYGDGNPLPYSEDQNTDHPLSPYAASKKAAETLCWTYHSLFGADVTVVRYFTVYGPAGRPDMSLFRFVQRIAEGLPITVFGDGEQSRDFTYVDDIARGTVAALRPLGYEIVNLGSDSPAKLSEMIELIEQDLGGKAEIRRLPRHRADVQATWADVSKAGRLLDWKPEVGYREGLSRLVAWYRENRDWARDIVTEC